MTFSLRVVLVLSLMLGSVASSRAEEGMWLPRQIPALAAKLQALGFKGDAQAFADLTGQPMGAVVSLGGCTAAFVSPDGLLATNHHCAIPALQYNSTAERNLLEDGFLAHTRAEELPNGPSARVLITIAAEDVTEAITGGIDPAIGDRGRFDLVDRRMKERVAACEADGLRCQVKSFFGGLQFEEIRQIELKDVRTVYAPPSGIGYFGGETDNWRWPRQTGDWSFFRAYVGKEGKPAAFSKDNVPYRPQHYLHVQPRGIEDGDLVFVVGYPGRTERHQTFAEVHETTEWYYPTFIKAYEEQIELLNGLAKENPDLAIKATRRLRGLENARTKFQGVLEGLVRGGALEQKRRAEQKLTAWISADPDRQKQFAGVLPGLAALVAERAKTRERDFAYSRLIRASSMLSAAQTAVVLAQERAKPSDLDREAGYQERDWARIRERQEQAQRSMDSRIDRALLRWALARVARLDPGQRIGALDTLIGLTAGMPEADADRAIDAYLDHLYADTRMGDLDFRLGLLEKLSTEIADSSDPMVRLALALEPLRQTIENADKQQEGAELRLRPRYMKALLAEAGGLVAPDANSTLRVTYGTVKGRPGPDGTCWLPFTTLAGIEQKQTGTGEFAAPQRELDAIAKLRASTTPSPYSDPALGDVPVDFLSTVDTTGGNSGSPTLDAKGELVGLLFDGTYDTIVADYLFDAQKGRSIHVDVRYLLWVMSQVDGAQNLLDEMGVGDGAKQ